MQFRSTNFMFDGKNSRDRNLKIVDIDGKNEDIIFGVEQNINEDDSVGDIPLFLGVKRSIPTIPITIMKMNNFNRPIPYSKGELEEICRWLFQKEYKPFISYDNAGIVYYVIFTKGNNFETSAKEGYLNLEMRLNAPHGYSNPLISTYRVKGEKQIKLYNNSNLDDIVYPDIEFELLNNTTSLEIRNESIGQSIIFNDLEPNEHIFVYNDMLKDVVSMTDKNRNIFNKFNKEWLKLRYGKNRIKIIGECKIKFINQYPIALM